MRTAAQGALLTVVGQANQGGGWFEVKGPTVTGWINGDPSLSAAGKFAPYTSAQHQLSLLYPDGWTFAELPPASVVFRPLAGADSVVATTAASIDLLGTGRPGYQRTNSQQIVVCGVTGHLDTYVQAAAPPSTPKPGGVVAEHYLLQVNLALDAQHALGLDANLGDTSQFQTFRNFVDSVTFPAPQCRPATA